VYALAHATFAKVIVRARLALETSSNKREGITAIANHTIVYVKEDLLARAALLLLASQKRAGLLAIGRGRASVPRATTSTESTTTVAMSMRSLGLGSGLLVDAQAKDFVGRGNAQGLGQFLVRVDRDSVTFVVGVAD